jgi:glycosyltransferase involved in cell wall biosynthesis
VEGDVILYLTRNGLMEPLGYRQVYKYINILGRRFPIFVISFEKSSGPNFEKHLLEFRRNVEEKFEWHPIVYSRRYGFFSVIFGILTLVTKVATVCLRTKVTVLHARSYPAMFIGALLKPFFGYKLIFDMRGLWIDELISTGMFVEGSFRCAILRRLEYFSLRRSDCIVVLTKRTIKFLRARYLLQKEEDCWLVHNTFTDLTEFKPKLGTPVKSVEVGVCIGSILSGWFDIELLCNWLRLVLSEIESEFHIITSDDIPSLVAEFKIRGINSSNLKIYSVEPSAVPEVLKNFSYGVMFYRQGLISELARAPTRLGEYFACGLPVVASSGIGDSESFFIDQRAGILIENNSDDCLRLAYTRLRGILRDVETALTCRAIAEKHFDLMIGVEAYATLYERLGSLEATSDHLV